MRLALYFSNKGLGAVDCSVPELGNPGIGGTEYCFLLLMYSLKKYKNNYEIIVYVNELTSLPYDLPQVVVPDLLTALSLSSKSQNDLFVMKQVKEQSVFEALKLIKQKVIVWGHNFYFSDLAQQISDCNNVVLNVFVGKQQYDRYVDHELISKSIYIYDMIPSAPITSKRFNDQKTVVYLGSLVPSKGFHVLAKQWKTIIKSVPNAHLKVIGTGKVYDRNSSLGNYGIAEKAYEDIFIPYLTDNNGDLLPSVEFLGVLGREKYDVFLNSSVGVVNPSARTETFGMSIIEMNSVGLPVVTLNKNGFADTVINGKTGVLVSSINNLSGSIINMLTKQGYNEKLGLNAYDFSKLFLPEIIVDRWEEAFKMALGNKSIPYIPPNNYFQNNYKWLRILNRIIRMNMKLSFLPTIIKMETFVYCKVLKH